MPTPRHIRTGLAAALVLALAGGLATLALGNFPIYNNSFAKPAHVKQIKKAGGGRKCAKRFVRKGNRRMQAIVSSGPTHCRFRPPVQGNSAESNHILQVVGRIARSGPQAARRTAFLTARARVGAGHGYSLHVMPQRGEWELRRSPGSEEFPVSGESDAIRGLGRLNQLRLVTNGATIRAFVNGTLLTSIIDSNPGAVEGLFLQFGIGHDANTQRNVAGAFTRVRVAIPASG